MRYIAPMTDGQLQDFARRYTAAWCSHDPDSVAAFFSEDGSLAVNGQEPAVGRPAISAVAQGFYDAFPDTVVILDSARVAGIEPSSSGRTRGRTPDPAGPAMRCVSTGGSSGRSATMDS